MGFARPGSWRHLALTIPLYGCVGVALLPAIIGVIRAAVVSFNLAP